ncbi:SH3 domain-containing protein, partial [Patescibacteria group bacterium]|nr:SH3 domain-containing protein [Patescibacteria group bacterium]
KAIAQENIPKVFNNTSHTKIKPKPRILEMILAVSILFFFSSYGLYNITKTTIKNKGLITPLSPAHPQVSGAKDVKSNSSPTPEHSIKNEVNITEVSEQNEIKTIVIKIADGTGSVELRKLPAFESEVIGTAKNGEEFELISVLPQWYEIKLGEGQNAFVQENYSEIVAKENKI